MQNFLEIGKIVKPQGVKGELKVMPLTDDPARFKTLREVVIDGATFKVSGVKLSPDAVFLSLSGVSDRDYAETFRNKFVAVSRENAVELKENTFFIVDLIGCSIVDEKGNYIAEITDVTKARTDIITASDKDGKTMRFPFLKKYLISVDEEKGVMTVDGEKLGEVCCYED